MKRMSVDEELYNATCEKLLQLGYPIHDPATRKAIEPYLKIANYYTSGTHLNTKDMSVRTCISAVIAIMSFLDDLRLRFQQPIGARRAAGASGTDSIFTSVIGTSQILGSCHGGHDALKCNVVYNIHHD